jgi:hypothetical protein
MGAVTRSLSTDWMGADGLRAWLFSLRRSLDGKWGLLFSHADDFAEYGFEADRWLAHVRAAFEATRILPIALANEVLDRGTTWIAELDGLTMRVRVDEIRSSASAYEDLIDMRSTSHDEDMRRCVLLLDSACRLRWSFQYLPGASLPSPIELAALAEAKRREHEAPLLWSTHRARSQLQRAARSMTSR